MYITEYFKIIIKRIKDLDTKIYVLNNEINKLSGWTSDNSTIPYLHDLVKNEAGIMAIMENSVVRKELEDYETEKGPKLTHKIAKMYKELLLAKEEKVRLTSERDLMLSSVLKFANIRVDEAIWLLEQYNLHFSPILMGDKTYLVPVDFKFQETAINGQILDNLAYYFNDNIELFQEEVKGTNLPIYYKDHKWVFTILPMYRKDNDPVLGANILINKLISEKVAERKNTISNIDLKKHGEKDEVFANLDLDNAPLPYVQYYIQNGEEVVLNDDAVAKLPDGLFKEVLNEIRNKYLKKIYEPNKFSLNNQFLNLIPSIKVEKGVIPFYKRDREEGVSLNGDILNIFPEEALGVLEYYIERKCINPTIKLEEAYQELNNKELAKA